MSETPSGFVTGSALPFKTQDAILANCLRAAGFAETMLSPLNLFDADILFRVGGGSKDKDGKVTKPSRYAGLNIVEAARRAHKEGQRGRVEYHFTHNPEIPKFCRIYTEQCQEIEHGENKEDASGKLQDLIRKAGKQEKESSEFPGPRGSCFPDSLDPREVLMRVLCIALKLRIEFVNRWKKQTPYLVIRSDATASTQRLPDGGKLESIPGGSLVPITAPDQTFKNLGLI